jgi:hypothetical protein
LKSNSLLIFFIGFLAFFSINVFSAEEDKGLRVYEDSEVFSIAVDADNTSPFKIHIDGVNYSIGLVDPADPLATKYRLKHPDGTVKALKKFSELRHCDANTMVIIKSWDGEQTCPAGYAAFAIDDPASEVKNSIALACCPLPKSDILSASNVKREKECGADEVATGCFPTGGSFHDAKFICSAINTTKYKLDSEKTTCYLGSGAAGRGGAASCHTPPETVSALIGRAPFGSDACVGSPYGALITKKTGKNCSNMKGRLLRYRDTNQPVVMFPPE